MAIHASTTSWKAVERTKLDIYVCIDYNCDKSVYIKFSVHNALLELPSSGTLPKLPSSGMLTTEMLERQTI